MAMVLETWMNEYTDWDGRKFVIIGSSKNPIALAKLSTRLCSLCWPGDKPYDHFDDVKIITNLNSQIMVSINAWQNLGLEKQNQIQDFVNGFLACADDMDND